MTRTPAISNRFPSMDSSVTGRCFLFSLPKILSGAFSMDLILSIGLWSLYRESSSFKTLNFVSTSIMAQRYRLIRPLASCSSSMKRSISSSFGSCFITAVFSCISSISLFGLFSIASTVNSSCICLYFGIEWIGCIVNAAKKTKCLLRSRLFSLHLITSYHR